VSGRVQGVWFRDSCRERARGLGVTGWVHNLSDGRVEAVFEGEPDAVDAMVAWCHDGPQQAVVVSVDVLDEQPQGETGFETR
jgi:acylphosphatase